MSPGDKVCHKKGYDCQRVGKTLEALTVKLRNSGIHNETMTSDLLNRLHPEQKGSFK